MTKVTISNVQDTSIQTSITFSNTSNYLELFRTTVGCLEAAKNDVGFMLTGSYR